MVVIAGLMLAMGVLWAWLAGHWFARVVIFVALAGLLGIGASNLSSGQHPEGPIVLLVCGVIAAWFVSGIPVYMPRWKARYTAMMAAPMPPYPWELPPAAPIIDCAAQGRADGAVSQTIVVHTQVINAAKTAPHSKVDNDHEEIMPDDTASVVRCHAFITQCGRVAAAGNAAYPDFDDCMKSLWITTGGFSDGIVEAALEIGDAHIVLYRLSHSPALASLASQFASMHPAQLGVAMARLVYTDQI